MACNLRERAEKAVRNSKNDLIKHQRKKEEEEIFLPRGTKKTIMGLP